MTAPVSPPFAWEPLTPRGVAAFARATTGRLLLVQFIVALLAAAAVSWSLYHSWFPTVRDAIRQLPAGVEIRSGTLDWPDLSPHFLAEGQFLAFSVDLEHRNDLRSPAPVQVEFGRTGFLVCSTFGCSEFPYPQGWIIAFNRTELEPWWGAWQPELLALAAVGVIVALLLIWALMATAFVLPVWLVGFFTNCDLSLRGSWRLAGASLMPGALLMTAAILACDFGLLDWMALLFVMAVHPAVGWIYLGLSPLFLPRHAAAAVQKKNPFVPPPTQE